MAAIGRLNPVTGKITMYDAEKRNPVPDAKKNDNENRSKKVHKLDDLIKASRK